MEEENDASDCNEDPLDKLSKLQKKKLNKSTKEIEKKNKPVGQFDSLFQELEKSHIESKII